MGQFRGLKRDVWEGGHHVPFIVKWPNQIGAGTVSDEVILQIDIMATLAKIVNIELPENAAPDNYNFLPVLKGEKYTSSLREVTIHNTYKEVWGIRKFINNPTGSGPRKAPGSFMKLRGYEDFDTPGLLFNMKEDEEQRIILFGEKPEKVAKKKLLEESGNSKSTVN